MSAPSELADPARSATSSAGPPTPSADASSAADASRGEDGPRSATPRVRVAHVLFARRDPVRPVLGFVWDALRAMAEGGLDVEPIIILPASWVRRLGQTRLGTLASPPGARAWPSDIEARLAALHPRPTIVHSWPWPRRSIEAGALALTAALIARRPAERPTILHGSFLDEGGFAASFAGRVLGVPTIAVAHGSDVRAARGELDRGRRARARATLRRADRILTVSRFLAEGLAPLGVDAEVVRWTTRADRFPLSPRLPGRRVILFVGHVGRGKGVDLLLRAFAALGRSDVVLRIVGPDAGDLDVLAEAQALGIGDRVERLGPQPEAALADVYAGATLTVLPSRHEGFGVVMVESLLVGRPIVGVDVGGIGELARDAVGALVPASEDVAGLAGAFSRVLERSARGAFPPAELRAQALPFTWEVNGPRLASVARALARHQGPT